MKHRPLIIGSVIAALGLSVGGITLATATQGPSTEVCSTQSEALECLDGLREYVQNHPDPTPTSTPTETATPTVPPTTTVPPVTPTATSTATPPASDYPSGMPWSSGVWSQHSSSQVAAFATMRGRPVDNIAVFPSRDSWGSLLNTWWLSTSTIPANFKGDLSVAVPLWTQNSSVNANQDANWKAFANAVATKDKDAYIRLGWEMNLPGSFWKVTAGNRTEWIASFGRAVDSMHAVQPGLRIVYNPNWGNDQTGTDSRSVFTALKSKIDVYAIDMYDSYPPDKSANQWDQRLNGSRGLKDSMDFAKTNGKKFALPEWGVACNGGGCQWAGNAGGDNPRYINNTLDYLGSRASEVAFESYFNEAEPYIRSELSPTNTNPQAAAAYRTKLAELAS